MSRIQQDAEHAYALPPLSLPGQGAGSATIDLAALAPRLVEAAVAVTTGRMHLSAASDTRRRLVQGDEVAAGYFRHELARNVAALLLHLDSNVVGVYEEHDMPEAEEMAPEQPACFDPLRLIVCVEVRTPAIDVVIRGLGEALADASNLEAMTPSGSLLHASIVERRDARLRPRALGFRPAPTMLAERDASTEDTGTLERSQRSTRSDWHDASAAQSRWR